MAKVAVAYWLVLATAAGPWLCCCATARAAAGVRLLASTAASPSGGHGGCCSSTSSSGDSAPDREPSPRPSSPTECPCSKAYVADQPVLPPETGGTLRLADRHADVLCGAAAGAAGHPQPLPPQSLRDRNRSAFSGSPRELLAVLKTLRC